MELPLWIIKISMFYMFCGVATSTDDNSVVMNMTSLLEGNGEQTKNNSTSNTDIWTTKMYITLVVPITLLLLAAIIIAVLMYICRHKRGKNIIQQESVYYGNSDMFRKAENNGYNSAKTEKDNSKEKPPKVEPIYINVQDARNVYTSRPLKPGECLEQSVECGRTDNIYCNVGCDTQQ